MEVSSSTENNREANDFASASITNYRNFMPCEYITINHPEYHRKESAGHYLQQSMLLKQIFYVYINGLAADRLLRQDFCYEYLKTISEKLERIKYF